MSCWNTGRDTCLHYVCKLFKSNKLYPSCNLSGRMCPKSLTWNHQLGNLCWNSLKEEMQSRRGHHVFFMGTGIPTQGSTEANVRTLPVSRTEQFEGMLTWQWCWWLQPGTTYPLQTVNWHCLVVAECKGQHVAYNHVLLWDRWADNVYIWKIILYDSDYIKNFKFNIYKSCAWHVLGSTHK